MPLPSNQEAEAAGSDFHHIKEDEGLLRYVLKRILWMIPVILGVLFIVFFISYITPGDAAMAQLGTNYTEEAYAAKVAELGLDRPFFVQFFDYVIGLVTRFDMGTSYTYGHSVSGEILTRMPVTLKIGLFGVLLTLVIGLPIGIISATKQYSILDYSVTVVSMIFAAMPGFWMAMMMMLLFALKLGWLPATGINSWQGYIMPVLCNALSSAAIVVRMLRSSMLEVIRQDYIRTARAKGLSEGVIIRRHALKNSLMPVITVIGMQVSMIMGGSVIIETIFNITGLGSYLVGGITSRDYPVVCGCVLMISLCVCIMNLLVDLVYAFIDPRVKAQYSAGKKRRISGEKRGEAA